MILLDTSACIELLRSRGGKGAARGDRLRLEEVAISTVALAELYEGVAGAEDAEREEEKLDALCRAVEIWSFDRDAARVAGRIAMTLGAKGRSIGVADVLIGAHALSRGASVATTDVGRFRRIENLRVIAWA